MDAGVLILIVAVLAVVAGGAFYVIRQRAGGGGPDTATIAQRIEEAAPVPNVPAPRPLSTTELKQSDALAILEILQGPVPLVNGEPVGNQIEIHRKRVTIGRNPRQVDVQLYNLDEPSSVSRLHCTIEFYDTMQFFTITDEGSSSGTRVEGHAVSPYQPHSLKNGDVIELGIPDKQGAILRFSSAFNPPERLSIQRTVDAKDTIRQSLDAMERGVTQPVRRDVFLSYSRRDREKMRVVREALVGHGLTVWTDESLEPGGQHWQRDVRMAIEGAGCVVAILSPDAKDSEWVNEELNYAKIRKVRIFTVVVRGDESISIPFGLTGIQWIDMRTDYEAAIEDIVHQSAVEQLVAAINEYLGRV